jgi:ADP-glucose pyrophosphorylase
MLLLLSPMTEKSFWTSELQLLTSNWTKSFSLMSQMGNIYTKHPNRPSSCNSLEKETEICNRVCLLNEESRIEMQRVGYS